MTGDEKQPEPPKPIDVRNIPFFLDETAATLWGGQMNAEAHAEVSERIAIVERLAKTESNEQRKIEFLFRGRMLKAAVKAYDDKYGR